MNPQASYLPYESTGYFSKIVADYLSGASPLRPFYRHEPGIHGIKQSIEARKKFNTPRSLLRDALVKQYEGIAVAEKLQKNINALADEQTFTVTTAHQPNIFTGPLYFIYKIIHTIKLADELNGQLPGQHFVPVYYMGSEDADLDELGFFNAGGQKFVWETKQTGAVGRMKVDKALIQLIRSVYGQTGVLPFGDELNELFTKCYTEGRTIQQAMLELVNALFGVYGLVVLVPDNPELKKAFHPVVEKELLEGFSHKAVSGTIEKISQHYKVQAGGREINLFYLIDDKRERIEKQGVKYEVQALGLSFSKEEILRELSLHPERFSANVILRGAFQETVLPNIAFIGGGGELAYWLELKDVFDAAGVPYPVLLLRNSFLLVDKKQLDAIAKMNIPLTDIFLREQQLLNDLVKRESNNQLSFAEEKEQAHQLYTQLKQTAQKIDPGFDDHIAALETKALKKIEALEKKLLRAERNKYEVQQKRISAFKQQWFPNQSLQERVDNFSLYYAKEGKAWLQKIYDASHGFTQGFGIITI